jgi:hypothetical protein
MRTHEVREVSASPTRRAMTVTCAAPASAVSTTMAARGASGTEHAYPRVGRAAHRPQRSDEALDHRCSPPSSRRPRMTTQLTAPMIRADSASPSIWRSR